MEDEDIIKDIVLLAETSPVLSLRGYFTLLFDYNYPKNRTCFYVLGIIARNPQGAEILEDFNWIATVERDYSNGLCIPTKLNRFFGLEKWNVECKTALSLPADFFKLSDLKESDILKQIGNLGNQIIATAASKSLMR